jgi:hypothetical protein
MKLVEPEAVFPLPAPIELTYPDEELLNPEPTKP